MNIIKRIKKCIIHDEKFVYSYFATFVGDFSFSLMQNKADFKHLVDRYKRLKNGEIANRSENRMVLHHLLRCNEIDVDDAIKHSLELYRREKKKCYDFSKKIKNREIVSQNGKQFVNFVQVGIGGSILGCEFLYNALLSCSKKNDSKYKAVFIANIDEMDIVEKLKNLDLRETLFIFASKSGTTKEIQIDKMFIEKYIREHDEYSDYDLKKHSICITSIDSVMDKSDCYFEKFHIDNNIGGRFSISSAMAILLNSIIFGSQACDEFLSGMEYMDKCALEYDIKKNVPMLSALMNFYEQRYYFVEQNIIAPYAEGMRYLPDFLSQLFMESLGKDRNENGRRVYYKTGAFLFGDRGNGCQHSFFQMLHNGTGSCNIEFVAFSDKKELFGNCLAQSVALYSRNKENRHRKVINKILCFDKYNPFNIGQIISFYENKVMFLGFLYNVNSYDQSGVEFGKKLYRELENKNNEELNLLFEELKICNKEE